MHDSADDESELTDIEDEDEEEPRAEETSAPMFPGLKAREGSAPHADAPQDEQGEMESEVGTQEAPAKRLKDADMS